MLGSSQNDWIRYLDKLSLAIVTAIRMRKPLSPISHNNYSKHGLIFFVRLRHHSIRNGINHNIIIHPSSLDKKPSSDY